MKEVPYALSHDPRRNIQDDITTLTSKIIRKRDKIKTNELDLGSTCLVLCYKNKVRLTKFIFNSLRDFTLILVAGVQSVISLIMAGKTFEKFC